MIFNLQIEYLTLPHYMAITLLLKVSSETSKNWYGFRGTPPTQQTKIRTKLKLCALKIFFRNGFIYHLL